MLLWLMIILLLALTLAALLMPLYGGRQSLHKREVFDANIYKDQLGTVERELDEGQISGADAEAARIEISRKLLAVTDQSKKAPTIAAGDQRVSRLTAILLGLFVPVFAVGFYWQVGSPDLRDQPLHARNTTPSQSEKQARIFAAGERMLQKNPDDGQVWDVMAPLYLRAARYDKAEKAYRNSLRLLGPSAPRLSGLSDAIIFQNKGKVPDRALPFLKQAMKVDPDDPKPRFWMGLYHEQGARLAKAEGIYTNLLKKSDEKSPWRKIVHTHLNSVRKLQGKPVVNIAGVTSGSKIMRSDANAKQGQVPGGPSAQDVVEAGKLSAEDRAAFIDAMVARLSKRLYDQGGNVKSWMQLVRVLKVQGKKQEAQKAVVAAKKNLKNDKQALAQLDAFVKQLGLGS